jgi:hypothetical protein
VAFFAADFGDDQVTRGSTQKIQRRVAQPGWGINFVLHLAREVLVNKSEPWA